MLSFSYNAFLNATSLNTVEFEATSILTTIGTASFKNCTSLNSIIIPASVSTLGNNAFSIFRFKIATVSYNRLNTSNFPTALGAGQTIGSKSGVLIKTYSTIFYTNSGSQYVNITGTLSTGDLPFTVGDITSVSIGNTVTSIGTSAFQNATSLTSVTFQATSTVSTIGYKAFMDSGLTSITIPNTVTQYCS